MLPSLRPSLLAITLVAALAVPALAGMPALLPDDLPTRLRLQDSAAERLTAISFFLGGIFLSAIAVCLLWNYLQRDFTWLPRLTVLKSLALVVLWGLLFVIVLTMISGARELMTPGAWVKQGFTYKLAQPAEQVSAKETVTSHDAAERREQLASIRTSLWLWAGAHNGQLPASLEESGVNATDWIYSPGHSLNGSPQVLVCEREITGHLRLALRTDGEIVELAADEAARLSEEQRP